MSRHVAFRAFRGPDFGTGVHLGTMAAGSALGYGAPAGVMHRFDPHAAQPQPYAWTAWLSPQVEPGFAFTELVPSWNARTPDDSWLTLEVRVSADGVRWSRWYTLARWAEHDDEIRPASRKRQEDARARVATDVLRAREGVAWSTYQLRVGLLRRPGSDAAPRVRMVGAVASAVPRTAPDQVSPGGAAWGVELPVPPHSQQLHRGAFPQWAGGGEAWCSPSATTMVLEAWGLGPTDKDYAWVPEEAPDPAVVHAARRVFDASYRGCGNWPFNTAYAGTFGAEAFVTRLRSLTEMETLVAAGFPLVATVAFEEHELAGAGYRTDGHLLVVRGFTADGDVICNDPASHKIPDNAEVRVVYPRAAFERVWLGASAGIVYVIRPEGTPLPPPPDPAEPNW